MTDKEKAIAYDKAIEKARAYYNSTCLRNTLEAIENIFPEIKEEMNEKIKACIKMCLTDANEQRFKDYNTTLKDCLEWFENKNSHKLDNVVKPIFNVGDTVRHKNIEGLDCTIESIDDLTYYGNTTNFDIKDQNKWKLVEPIDSIAYSKDTVWNESDRLHLGSILSILKAERNNAEVEQYRDSVNSDIDWLNNLKNYILQLNTEDLKRINRISDFILKNRKGDTDEIYQQEQDVKWLKSLKYLNKCSCQFDEIDKEILRAAVLFVQNNTDEFACNGVSKEDVIDLLDSLTNSETWQPTKMQLNAFEQVYDWYNNNFAPSETLTSLYNDLKKLYEK